MGPAKGCGLVGCNGWVLVPLSLAFGGGVGLETETGSTSAMT